jgi:hypothetical protein
LVLGDDEATTKLGMGMAEVSAGVAVARLFAEASIIGQHTPALGLLFLVAGRHRSTS